MKTCSTCGETDQSDASKAVYHRCGLDHLRVHNEKLRDRMEEIGRIATNEKIPAEEAVAHILAISKLPA